MFDRVTLHFCTFVYVLLSVLCAVAGAAPEARGCRMAVVGNCSFDNFGRNGGASAGFLVDTFGLPTSEGCGSGPAQYV